MMNRRGFLVGGLGLLTSSFVRVAEAFSRQTGMPQLIAPPRIDQTIYWYENGDELLLSFVHMNWTVPHHPLGGNSSSNRISTTRAPGDLTLVWEEYGVEPANYDDSMDGQYWQDYFDTTGSPTARAYKILNKLNLGPSLADESSQPHMIFHEGAFPGDSSRWVATGNQLAPSILQARCIDLSPQSQ